MIRDLENRLPVGRRHSLDAEMPRHLTPCRLWQSSRIRCGSPATPAELAQRIPAPLKFLQVCHLQALHRLIYTEYQGSHGDQIYGAILEGEDGIPAVRTNLAQETDPDAERITARYTSSSGPPRRCREVGRAGLLRGERGQAPGRALPIQSAACKLRIRRIT